MELSQRQNELAHARMIDEHCNRFEAQWRAGKRPQLESVLASAPQDLQAKLLRDLLSVELELLAREGTRTTEEEYRIRFLQFAEVVGEVFAEVLSRRAAIGEGSGSGKAPTNAACCDTAVSRASAQDQDRKANPLTGPYRAPEHAAGPPTLPAKIGRFEIVAVLGEGAFGKVYRARDPKLDREVAVKVPLPGVPGSEHDLERFLREARTAATVYHPNICPVYEVGQDGDTHYIVMAYISGQSLAALLKSRKAPLLPRQAVLVVRKLAQALEAAHARGIVHRDLKPSNILYDAARKEMVITDFGLARRIRQDEAQLTQSGVIMGTPAYMSPEQARGDARAVGPRSDVFSLGVILYELLTLQRPFTGSVGEVIGQVLHVEPEAPSKHRPGLDPALEALCLKALAKNPEQRYRSMSDFVSTLNDYLKGTAPAEPKVNAPAVGTAEAGAGNRVVAELVKELSEEHRVETAAAVEKAVKRARKPLWLWLLGSGFLGGAILFSILFFVRSGPATIIIQVPLPAGISLEDATLSFLLDGKRIAAGELGKPIALKPGDHELLIKRGEQEIKRMRFTVGLRRREVAVEVKEVTGPRQPMPKPSGKEPPVDQPATEPVGEVPLPDPETTGANAVAFAPDGRIAASGHGSGEVIVWDLVNRKVIYTRKVWDGCHVQELTFTPDGKMLFVGGNQAPVLWDVEKRRIVREFPGHTTNPEGFGLTWGVAVSRDGRMAASAGDDWTVRLWNVASGKQLHCLEGHTNLVYHVALSPDGRYAVSDSKDATIRLWDVKTGKEIRAFEDTQPHGGRSLSFTPDSKQVLSGGLGGVVRLWDVETGKEVRRFPHDFDVFASALTPDGRRALTASGHSDNTLRLWDVTTGRELHSFSDVIDVRNLAVSPDGRYVLTTGGNTGAVRLWRLPQPK